MFFRDEGWSAPATLLLLHQSDIFSEMEWMNEIRPAFIQMKKSSINYATVEGVRCGKYSGNFFVIFAFNRPSFFIEWFSIDMQRVNGPEGWHSVRENGTELDYIAIANNTFVYVKKQVYKREDGRFILDSVKEPMKLLQTVRKMDFYYNKQS